MPPGEASAFSTDIGQLVDNLLATFPAVFETPTFQQKKSAIDRGFNQRYDRALDVIERLALEKDVALYRDSANIAFTPMKDGKALDEADFAQLPEAERERFHEDISSLEERLNEELASLPQWKRESSNLLRQLNEETITQALQPLLAPLSEKYAENAGVIAYLQAMQVNLLKTVVDQMLDDKPDLQRREMLEEQYCPSLVVGNPASGGAPVVFESHPTYDNLFGRIEYGTDQGALYTSYRQLRPGALHRANGGFLVLEAEKLLSEPFVWDALKRALHSRQLKMESPLAELGRLATVTLTPQVIPLQLKVVIIGSRQLYTRCRTWIRTSRRCSACWWTSTRRSRCRRRPSNSSPSCSRPAPRKRAWRRSPPLPWRAWPPTARAWRKTRSASRRRSATCSSCSAKPISRASWPVRR